MRGPLHSTTTVLGSGSEDEVELAELAVARLEKELASATSALESERRRAERLAAENERLVAENARLRQGSASREAVSVTHDSSASCAPSTPQ